MRKIRWHLKKKAQRVGANVTKKKNTKKSKKKKKIK